MAKIYTFKKSTSASASASETDVTDVTDVTDIAKIYTFIIYFMNLILVGPSLFLTTLLCHFQTA